LRAEIGAGEVVIPREEEIVEANPPEEEEVVEAVAVILVGRGVPKEAAGDLELEDKIIMNFF
jgi:hypothetical protein